MNLYNFWAPLSKGHHFYDEKTMKNEEKLEIMFYYELCICLL